MKKKVLRELLAKRTKEILEERLENKVAAAKTVIDTFNKLPEAAPVKKPRKKKEDK